MSAEDGDRQYSTLDRAALAGIDQYKLIKTIKVEDDGTLLVSLSPYVSSDNDIKIIDRMHNEVHDGQAYFARGGGRNFGPGVGIKYLITTGAKEAHCFFKINVIGSALIIITKDVTVVNPFGAVINFQNAKFSSSNTALSKMYENPTDVSGGTLVAYMDVGEESVLTPVCPSTQEWILKPNTSYTFTFISGCASMGCNMCIEMYEEVPHDS